MNRDDSDLTNEELTVEALQDLLIYDDMFLDYFNVFLKLPVFPQPMEYQRLTDSFNVVEEGSESVVTCESPPQYMANEEEHSRLLSWAQKYRLPLFLNTNLFRQLKLAKLLMRPLEQNSTSRNTFLRGYSKRSNFSLFTSRSNSTNDLTTESKVSDEPEEEESNRSSEEKQKTENIISDYNFQNPGEDYIPYDTYIRPGSEAISLPMEIETEKAMKGKINNRKPTGSKLYNGVSDKSKEVSFVKGSRQKSMTFDYTDNDSLFYRIQSAPLQFNFVDFDFVYTNKVLYAKHRALNFGSIDAEEEEENMEAELGTMEQRQKLSLYRLKGLIIGTSNGMIEFKKFLKNTVGNCLCDFWLDCEQFKDSSNGRTEDENINLMNKLLRNLQDKYKLKLTKLAKQQLSDAMNNPEKITSLFLQSQYDSLRRLRSYWLPRFLLHEEYCLRQHTLSDLYFLRLPTIPNENISVKSGVFPKINVEKVLPYSLTSVDIRPCTWNQINRFQNTKTTEPNLLDNGYREKSDFSSGILARSVFQRRLREALAIDTISGNPFRNYLQSRNLLIQLNNLEFYQEIGKFKFMTKANADRLLRMSHAWSIVNRFMVTSGKESIGINEHECKETLHHIKTSKGSMKDNIFDFLLENSVKKLEQEWLRYLKEDMKRFMESSLTRQDPHSPPHSLDEVEVVIEGEAIVVRRKCLAKDLQTRIKTWDTLSKDERRRRREKALELRLVTEIERQKVLKAVANRIRIQLEDEKRLKSIMSQHRVVNVVTDEAGDLNLSKDDTVASVELVEINIEDRSPEMKKVLENKVLLNLFKKYVSDHADSVGRECLNIVMLLQDLSGYFSLQGYDKGTLTKKDHKSNLIYKSYLEKSCKRPVPLSEALQSRLLTEKIRPKSPTLKEIQSHAYTTLSEAFLEFWKFETKELGVKSNVLAAMSENELQILAENQLNEINKSLKTKTVNTAAHTKEDKNEFILALSEAAYGALSLQMLHFYRFLVERGPEDRMNNLEKDLFFYVEILKLKEMFRTTVDEEIAKKKVQCISSSFLESVYAPSVQINVTNEIAQRAIKAVQRQLTYKDVSITIFDEAHGACLKTLLPYWAGFQRQWEETSDHLYRPVSKYQRMLERRKQMYNDIPIPKTETISLPILPKGANLSTLSYTMNDGAKWKEAQEPIQDTTPNSLAGKGTDDRKRSLNPRMTKGMSKASISISS